MPEFNFQDVADEPILKAGEEIDPAEFERRMKQREINTMRRADALVQLRTKQAEVVQRIGAEAQQVTLTYPELNPESEHFNKELTELVADATEAYLKVNPTASLKSFVARQMSLYKGQVTKEVGKVTGTIAKQVSQAALKPTNIRQPEKAAAEKTIAELEAELGVVQS